VFLTGLAFLSHEELVLLLAQIKVLNASNVLNTGLQKTAHTAKKKAFEVGRWIADKVKRPEFGTKLGELDARTEWDYDVTARRIAQEVKALSVVSVTELQQRLRQALAEIAKIDPSVKDDVLAHAVVHRAAMSLKVDSRLYPDPLSLESAVYERIVRDMYETLQKRVATLSAAGQAELEELLRHEISKLTQSDKEALRKALGLEALTAGTMLTFLKTTSAVAAAQVLITGVGFGSYLFLATFIKALSLLLGITFSFGTYLAATSALAFLLSGPFLVIVAGISGGFLLHRANTHIGDEFAKVLILAGRAKEPR